MATQPTTAPPKPLNVPANPDPAKHEADKRESDKHEAEKRGAAPEGAKFDAKDMIADEQRSRSAEIERKGVEQWKADHDDRDPNERPKPVAGLRQPGEPDPNFPEPQTPPAAQPAR